MGSSSPLLRPVSSPSLAASQHHITCCSIYDPSYLISLWSLSANFLVIVWSLYGQLWSSVVNGYVTDLLTTLTALTAV